MVTESFTSLEGEVVHFSYRHGEFRLVLHPYTPEVIIARYSTTDLHALLVEGALIHEIVYGMPYSKTVLNSRLDLKTRQLLLSTTDKEFVLSFSSSEWDAFFSALSKDFLLLGSVAPTRVS